MESSFIDIEDLFLNPKQRVQEYFIDTVQHIYVNEHITENRISTHIERKYFKKDNYGHLIGLYVRSREQHNLEGMLAVENRLAVLFEKVLIYLDNYGKIKSVPNLGEIRQNWYDEKSDFKKEFKDAIDKIDVFLEGLDVVLENQKSFIQILEKSDIVTLVLPPIYSQGLFDKSISDKKVYDSFFGNNDIPMRIDSKLIAKNEITNGYQVVRSGDIDYARIDLNNIKQFFRTNYNNQSLAVKLDVAYLETIDLDENNDVDTATLMMGIEIKDQYQFRQVSKTQKLS